jgi:hypothetical protein
MGRGRLGEALVYAGTDFIIARDGRIAAIYLFLTSYPERQASFVVLYRSRAEGTGISARRPGSRYRSTTASAILAT